VSHRPQDDPERIRSRAHPPAREPEEAAGPLRSPLQRLAAGVGNRAMARSVLAGDAAPGAGIRADGTVDPEVQAAIDTNRGSGARLDPQTQERVAPALGDLSDVRVHTGDGADRLNRAVSARAFTTGSDVYFGAGQYSPGSAAGDRLIAHELAHVVQQRGSAAGGPLAVSQPGDALEREADEVADQL
jgi:hypothetical protein